MTDSELDALLRDTSKTVEVPPTFQREVWRRIETASSRSLAHRLRGFVEALLLPVTRPALASVVLLLTIAGGVSLGVRNATAAGPDDTAYAEAVSPFILANKRVSP